MGRIVFDIQSDTYNASDRTNVQITVPTGLKYDRHQLTIVTTGTPSAGTITVRRKAHNSDRFLAVLDRYGAALTISLATEDQVMIDGGIDSVELDIAGLATATGWYAVLSGVQ